MASSNVRISETAHRRLRELANNEHVSMQTVLERALEHYRRQRLLEAANKQYASLQANPAAWKQELQEREIWDRATADGVDEE